MKIILRKRDSVVSIVLFIFNVYSEFTGHYSIKLDHLIKCMSFFDKNETASRMGLSRMLKSEIVVNKKINNDIYYELTQYGKENLELWNLGVSRFFKRYSFRHQQWNNKWFMLALLNFSRSENLSIMDELTELGFRELTKDLLVSPYSMHEEVYDLLGSEHGFLEISGEIVSNSENYKRLEDIFGLEILEIQYNKFLDLSDKVRNKMALEKDLGRQLPLLFELGWNFYDIAINDPALPRAFLNDWIGDQAVAQMRDLRNPLYNNVTSYFSQLLNNN